MGAVTFSPDGRLLVTGGFDHEVRIWNPSNGQLLRTLTGHNDWVVEAAFSPDGKLLATGQGGDPALRTEDNHVILWDVASGARLRTLRVDGFSDVEIYSVMFTPDGNELITGSVNWGGLGGSAGFGRVTVWDLFSGKPPRTLFDDIRGAILAAARAPDGTSLITGGFSRVVRLSQLPSGRPITELRELNNWIYALAYSPDGGLIAAGTGNPRAPTSPGEIRLFDAASGTETGRLDARGSGVTSLAFSPDGTRIAAGFLRGPVRVWERAK